MDMKNVLNQILGSGQDLLGKTQQVAEQKLGIPSQGPSRDTMLSGLGKGALAGGLLAMLVGTKSGRRLGGKALKYGSIAAVAAVAYKAFESWQSNQKSSPPSNSQAAELLPIEDPDRGILLVRAMIAAANADGHIDDHERESIRGQLSQLGLGAEAIQLLDREVGAPLSVAELAQQVKSTASGAEVYLLSSVIVDDANALERQYLEDLAKELQIPADLKSKLTEERDS